VIRLMTDCLFASSAQRRVGSKTNKITNFDLSIDIFFIHKLSDKVRPNINFSLKNSSFFDLNQKCA